MDYGHGNDDNSIEIDDADDVDRLSGLPDVLIYKILSFISIKDVVQTVHVLSSRYRFIWATTPYLNFSTEDFPTSQKGSEFVTQFLKRRDSNVSSLKLTFRTLQPSVKKLMDYAFSHNIRQLDVEYSPKHNIEFPLSMFSSQSLKHLSLIAPFGLHYLNATSTLVLPALITLYLKDVRLCSDDNCIGLLSKCPNLKNLTLENCERDGSNSSMSICHPGLSDLTLHHGRYTTVKDINVVAPQLENLSIRNIYSRRKYMISAPNLASLAYRGDYPLLLQSTDGFHCLKEVEIRVTCPNDTEAHYMVCLLQQLYSVKFLKLNFEIIELLSSSVELISHQPSPFVNLKSLTIYPENLSGRKAPGHPKGKVDLFSKVKNYLLDSSPGATFTMLFHEEMIAQKLMAELRELLEQEKANTKTKWKAPMESDNANIRRNWKAQSEMKMQLQIGENIALIQSCWNDLSNQFRLSKANARHIISMLVSIEELLKMLPATNRSMIQPCFSSLYSEAVIIMSEITDGIKIECDEIQRHLTLDFH